MELRDRNGLTEKEYLAQYSPGDYPHPSVTVDVAVFRRVKGALRVLLIRRGGHPCLGLWALPGGFAEPQETTEEAAARELAEETGVSGLELFPLRLVSTPGRDPRAWTMTQPYAALVEGELPVQADDDAADAQWFDVAVQVQGERMQMILTGSSDTLFAECVLRRAATPFGETIECVPVRQQGIAFDHGRILCEAVSRLKI